jgi:hypothetical protein
MDNLKTESLEPNRMAAGVKMEILRIFIPHTQNISSLTK